MRQLTDKLPPQLKKRALLPPAWALYSVTSKSGNGVYASSDTLFKGAIFGRDSLEVADDLLLLKPRLVKRILITLARLQGEMMQDSNEEEPGKIVHEYRAAYVDGKPLDDVSKYIFTELSKRWGGDGDTMAYYGSVDSTPHFVRTLGAYCERYGDKILNQQIILRSGHKLRMKICLENAVDWIVDRLRDSASGLLEYKRRNTAGIENQVWKDSKEFYIHENGEYVNHDKPVASIEVQGLVYDALQKAAQIFPHKKEDFDDLASKLRNRTIELLWQQDKNYFALGCDYDEAGALRVIKTTTANPAALLDTKFFDDLPQEERRTYVEAIVRKIMSDEFLTDAGIRSRSLKNAHLIEYWDYHGSYTTWPKETYDIAKGLRHHGFPMLARQLENRLLNVALRSREYPEFVYVDKDGRVLASSVNSQNHAEVIMVDSPNSPEQIQAWTVSAVMSIVAHRLSNKVKRNNKTVRSDWQVKLEKSILESMKIINRLINPKALAVSYPDYPYKLVRDKSKQSESVLIDVKQQ